MTYTDKELGELFTLENVETVRYEYATVKTRHSKKGKKTIQTGGAYFVLKYKSGLKITLPSLVKLANELNERADTKAAAALEPFCCSLISRSVINTAKRDLLDTLKLPISDELKKAVKEEAEKCEERAKKRIDKIISILDGGQWKYVKNESKRARENAKKRFDEWEKEYGDTAAGATDEE